MTIFIHNFRTVGKNALSFGLLCLEGIIIFKELIRTFLLPFDQLFCVPACSVPFMICLKAGMASIFISGLIWLCSLSYQIGQACCDCLAATLFGLAMLWVHEREGKNKDSSNGEGLDKITNQ